MSVRFGALLLIVAVGLSACSATNVLPTGQVPAPFAGLPGPAPSYDANYDPASIWTGSGAAHYTTSELQQCKSLGLQDYLVRLRTPAVQQAQMSSLEIHCAWNTGTGTVEADVGAPVTYPVSEAWDNYLGTPGDNHVDLGDLGVGQQSDLVSLPLIGGTTRLIGIAKTASAIFYLNMFPPTGSKVPEAWYKGAIAQMLGQLIKSTPTITK